VRKKTHPRPLSFKKERGERKHNYPRFPSLSGKRGDKRGEFFGDDVLIFLDTFLFLKG
jgi:hypothetical protein